ncbi:hypothetical protein Leryth_025763 [Lithospermum erythrorhizon]|nr:hypothetical protein Leryth_025763 [Lithospermum erythrorhizon]
MDLRRVADKIFLNNHLMTLYNIILVRTIQFPHTATSEFRGLPFARAWPLHTVSICL